MSRAATDDPSSGRAHPLLQATLLGELLEHAHVAAFVVDDDGRYVAVNEYACTLTGYAREELLGLRVGELNPESDLPRQTAEIAAGTRSAGEVVIRTKSGKRLSVYYRAVRTELAGMPLYLGLCWPA
jgi:PAS domain S-box-containing protein